MALATMQTLEAELQELQSALQQYADSDPEKHDATGALDCVLKTCALHKCILHSECGGAGSGCGQPVAGQP